MLIYSAGQGLNLWKEENDHRNQFMINLHERYVAQLGSAVRCGNVCSMEPDISNQTGKISAHFS